MTDTFVYKYAKYGKETNISVPILTHVKAKY